MRQPTVQIIIDLKGDAVTKYHMYYLEYCVAALMGVERTEPNFWVTRTDIFHDFMAREVYSSPDLGTLLSRPKVSDEMRHEDSFDFYIDGAQVPTGRLINIAIPGDKL
jgi:hypothetical protein